MLNECNGCEYQCNLSHIDICTLGSPCPHQRSTPMTNEEYLRIANVNDMARCIATKLLELARHEYGIYDVVDYATIFEWLKQQYKDGES